MRAIAARHGINPNQLSRWKTEAHDGLLEVFGDGAGGGAAARDTEKLIERLYARIGELVLERDVFSRGSARSDERSRRGLSGRTTACRCRASASWRA